MLFLGLRYPSPAFSPVTLIKDGILKIFVIEMDPPLIIYLVLKDFPPSSLCHCHFYYPSTSFAHLAHVKYSL